MTFQELVNTLKQFKLTCAPFNEEEIEKGIERFLKQRNYPVHRQVVIKIGRFDLTVGKFVIEAKVIGQKKVAEQLDRYSGKCEGLILICWKATKPLKRIFEVAKQQSKIPVELIEVNKNCDMV